MEHPMAVSEALQQTITLIKGVQLPIEAVDATDRLRVAVHNLDLIFQVLKKAEEESLQQNEEQEVDSHDSGAEAD